MLSSPLEFFIFISMGLPFGPERDNSGIVKGAMWSAAAIAAAAMLAAGDTEGATPPEEVIDEGCGEDSPEDPSTLDKGGRLLAVGEHGNLLIHADFLSLPPEARFDQAARVSVDIRERLVECKGNGRTDMKSELSNAGMEATSSIDCVTPTNTECHVGFRTEQGNVSFEATLAVSCRPKDTEPDEGVFFVASSISTLCVEELITPCLTEVISIQTPDETRIFVAMDSMPLNRWTLLPTEDPLLVRRSSIGPEARQTFADILGVADIYIPDGAFTDGVSLFDATGSEKTYDKPSLNTDLLPSPLPNGNNASQKTDKATKLGE